MNKGKTRGVNKKYRIEFAPFVCHTVRLTETQFLIWLSAWLDTEGSIVLYGDKKYPTRYAQITICQKDVTPLKIIETRIGGHILSQRQKNLLMYRWVLSGYKAVDVLKKIANYLVVKKAKAINVIQYYELKNSGKADRETHEKYRNLVNDQSKNRKYKSRILDKESLVN